jgi:hypothetical protein
MNPVSVDIKDLLVNASIGAFASDADWAINISHEPATPDNCITIYDTGGPRPSYHFTASTRGMLYSDFQVRVRGNSYLAVWNRMQDILVVIDHIGRFVVSGDSSAESDVVYSDIQKTTEAEFLKKDANERTIFVCNFRAFRQEQA